MRSLPSFTDHPFHSLQTLSLGAAHSRIVCQKLYIPYGHNGHFQVTSGEKEIDGPDMNFHTLEFSECIVAPAGQETAELFNVRKGTIGAGL